MAKLTRKQRADVAYVLSEVMRTKAMIENPRTLVAVETGSPASITFEADGKRYHPINKEYGSDLCGLHFAVKRLELMIMDPQ